MAVSIKRGSNKPQKLVVHDFSLVSPNRNRKDVGILKKAIVRAESIQLPNRTALLDIYTDVVTIDGHLSGILSKRTRAVTNKSLVFKDAKGRKVDVFDKLIYSKKFKRLIKLIQESQYWGVSGVEFIVGKKFDFVPIPRKHIRPEKDIIVNSQYAHEGTPISELPFVWTIGEPNDLGQLLQCSMYAIYKRSGFGDFAQFVEIFGQPVRIIYYDAHDSRTKDDVRKVLNESGSSLAMMIPKQAQFEMMDGKTSNANGDLQINLINACNAEMSVAILGNTETTVSSKSSGYAQSETQSKQQLEITKDDIEFVQNTLNEDKFLDILRSYGYPVDGGSFEYEQEVDLDTLKKKLEIDILVSTKVYVDKDYWYDTYGIPRPENEPEPEEEDKEEEDTNPIEEEKEPEKDVVITRKGKNLIDRLGTFFFGMDEQISLNDYYKPCKCGCNSGVNLPNLSDENWEDIYTSIAKQMLSEQLRKGSIPQDLYFSTAERLMDGINSGLGGSSFNYNDSRNVLKAYLTRNVYAFSAAKSLTQMLEFRNLMYDKRTKEILPFAKFRDKVADAGYRFNGIWLQTEYDTALTGAIMAHKWDSINTEYLEYSTVGDERVRPEHAVLDGRTYPKNHQIWNKMYPPLGWNCRCTVIPGLPENYDPELADMDEKTAASYVKNSIFNNNVGKTKLVFQNDHPYYTNLPGGKTKQLGYDNYGLPSIQQIQLRGGLKPVSLLNSKEEYETLWSSLLNSKDGVVLKDPLGNNVLFPDYDLSDKKNRPKNYFKQHIGDRTDEPDRYKLLANLKEIVTKPDEVWSLYNEKYPGEPPVFHYIKHYEDKSVVVLTIENEGRTIFDLNQKGFRTRHGILLYRK